MKQEEREPAATSPRGRLMPMARGQDYYRDLLIALLALTLAYPLISAWPAGRLIEQVAFVGVLITSTLAVYQRRYQLLVAALVGLFLVFGGLINYLRPEPIAWLESSQVATSLFFLVAVTYALARDIFASRGKVTAGLLYGAVSVYLLIGVAFASGHFLLESLHPGSYQCGSPLCHGQPAIAAYIYFSFITLSTVGYGEILPATHVAATLAYAEATLGQMYTAILVARLVGMQIIQARD